MRKITIISMFIVMFVIPGTAIGGTVTESEFNTARELIKDYSPGDRIAFWARRFIGTPYDPDPLGEYVRERTLVADERVDCMYMTFRSVELALSLSYAQTIDKALSMRFMTRGVLDKSGRVVNYKDRYQYGIDMIKSGKFGTDVSGSIAGAERIKGSRGVETVDIINKKQSIASIDKIRNGDIIFFVKDPSKRKVGEIVGHIGIASRENNNVSLIHASGIKNGAGSVKKVDLEQYLRKMSFIGIVVTRFD